MDDEIIVFIEITKNTNIKYEYDETYNGLICDRILYTPMMYPFNYGFVPNTLSGDGDPLDVVVYMDEPLIPGCKIKCKIVGCLETHDEKGLDWKLIVVPIKKISPAYASIESLKEIPEYFINKLKFFYENYKKLENKISIVEQLMDKKEAIEIYKKTIIHV
jgi:inorganic pyrophosphatase